MCRPSRGAGIHLLRRCGPCECCHLLPCRKQRPGRKGEDRVAVNTELPASQVHPVPVACFIIIMGSNLHPAPGSIHGQG